MPRSRKPQEPTEQTTSLEQMALPFDDGAGGASIGLADVFDRTARGLTFDTPPDFDVGRLVSVVAAKEGVTPRQRKATAALREATRAVLTRPYCRQWAFVDPRVRKTEAWRYIFPTPLSELENRVIWLKTSADAPPLALISDRMVGAIPPGATHALPFYLYDASGRQRDENITDAALARFQTHYDDADIGKWDIFYYLYAVLHHPDFRAIDALPDVPFAPDFWGFAECGFRLAELHLYYDAPHIVEPYPLEMQWASRRRDWRVEKMRRSEDGTALAVNEHLTLAGIPPEASEYRLGKRSALEWVVDQYRLQTDRRGGVTADPNRPADPQAIVTLVRQVVAVSVETVRLVRALPPLA